LFDRVYFILLKNIVISSFHNTLNSKLYIFTSRGLGFGSCWELSVRDIHEIDPLPTQGLNILLAHPNRWLSRAGFDQTELLSREWTAQDTSDTQRCQNPERKEELHHESKIKPLGPN
jgi:hypothetical protein